MTERTIRKRTRPSTLAVLLATMLATGCVGDGAGGQDEPCSGGFMEVGGTCVPTSCQIPRAPTLEIVHAGAVLPFTTSGDHDLEVGTSLDPAARAPDAWLAQHWLEMPASATPATVKAFARVDDPSCPSMPVFTFVYQVREAYPPAASAPETTAVPMDDPAIVAWATGWEDPVEYGTELDSTWMTPDLATGPAAGTSTDMVCLGRGGSITMTFDTPIVDGEGWDLAVFENGLTETFLELAWVEVSTDGTTFSRFGSAYTGDSPVGSFGAVDTTRVGSLAGKYMQGWGTPFDLAVLANRPEVLRGLVDLDEINFVRIVDVVGDGSATDSLGHVIYDPYPTTGSAGFDLDAVGVIHQGS